MHGDSSAAGARMPTLPGTLPTSEDLRRTALQASWQRDRAVASRRLAWRWFAWYLRRLMPYVLGLTVVLGAAWLLWSRAQPVPAQPQAPAPGQTAVSTPDHPPLTLLPDQRLHNKEP